MFFIFFTISKVCQLEFRYEKLEQFWKQNISTIFKHLNLNPPSYEWCHFNVTNNHNVTLIVLKSCIVGIIVPDEEYLMKWAADNGLSKTFDELCQDEVILRLKMNEFIFAFKQNIYRMDF